MRVTFFIPSLFFIPIVYCSGIVCINASADALDCNFVFTIFSFDIRVWAAERDEFLGDDPVKVAVFHALVMFVFLHVEVIKIEEPELVALVDRVETIQQRYSQAGLSHRSVTKHQKRRSQIIRHFF